MRFADRMNKLSFIYRGLLGGACISVGGYIYLAVGGPVGAVLFAIGLLTVVHYGFLLYTGRIQNTFDSKADARQLIPVLLFNVIGCIVMSMMFFPTPDIVDTATAIVAKRTCLPPLAVLGRAIGCGFIMTIAVAAAKKGNYWPLLLGVPGFILAGFIHSIADAFYISVAWRSLTPEVMWKWLIVVLGNFIGGVIPVFFKTKQ